jgi:hypothetical protein
MQLFKIIWLGHRLQNLSFWIVVLIVPLLVIVANAVVRWLLAIPHSATSDICLAFVVFDVAVAVHSHDFAPFVKMQHLQKGIVAIYLVLLILNLILWTIAAFVIEQRLLLAYNKQRKSYAQSPWRLVFASGFLAIFVFASNTILFAYGA